MKIPELKLNFVFFSGEADPFQMSEEDRRKFHSIEKENLMYVYIWSEQNLWTVGFYHPTGQWEAESDHTTKESAAKRVAYLNGSNIRLEE